jgi:uncharacterized repeat protein (TIGR04052 family)
MYKFISLTFIIMFLTLALADQNVTITFALKSGDQSATCGEPLMLGSTRASTQLLDARLFISEVEVMTEEGYFPLELEQDGVWQYENLALIDFENATGACQGTPDTNTQISGETTAPGTISGIRFTVGVPEELNHLDAATAPSPLNVTDMWWVWLSGYKFLRIDLQNQAEMPMGEGTPSDEQTAGDHGNGMPNAYFIHLGSTRCMGAAPTTTPDAPCGNSNRISVTLENFDPAKNLAVLDIQTLLNSVDVSQSLMLEPPGCMSGITDPDCLSLFTTGFGLSLNNGKQILDSPDFFRVE